MHSAPASRTGSGSGVEDVWKKEPAPLTQKRQEPTTVGSPDAPSCRLSVLSLMPWEVVTSELTVHYFAPLTPSSSREAKGRYAERK